MKIVTNLFGHKVRIFKFANGFGASVCPCPTDCLALGGSESKRRFEIHIRFNDARIKGEHPEGDLTERQVQRRLKEIAAK